MKVVYVGNKLAKQVTDYGGKMAELENLFRETDSLIRMAMRNRYIDERGGRLDITPIGIPELPFQLTGNPWKCDKDRQVETYPVKEIIEYLKLQGWNSTYDFEAVSISAPCENGVRKKLHYLYLTSRRVD
ncbi:MAG: hypothetical protein WCI72_00655 [archaeon]